MKLDYIHINDFKNLSNFSFDFDEKTAGLVTVLLGLNGTGKSNLLEALVIIFRDLYLGRETTFGYELRYVIGERHSSVQVKSYPKESARSGFSFTVVHQDGPTESVSRSQVGGSVGRKWLPHHVFAYYSGPSDRLEEHFRDHQRKFYRDLIDGNERPFRPLFYARPVHSQFVLMSFFISDDQRITKFLEEFLGILQFESALFVLRRPQWAKTARPSSVGDNRFWGARGVVASLLGRLHEYSLAPLRMRGKTKPVGIENPKETERVFLYLPDRLALRKVAPASLESADFFKELESTYISDLIEEVRIRVGIKGLDGSLTFRELSEGEQQLLTVVGLLRFTKETESLFLLDEPDTHLNPAWGMRYLEVLNEIAEPGNDSQILMATHDPMVISGLKQQEVVVMHRDTHTGAVEAFRPDVDPQGLGVVGILRSELFGLQTTLDQPTQQKLNERFELMARAGNLSEAESNQLRKLSDDLAAAGFANEFRDANFDRFAKAVSKVKFADKVVLTRDDIKELEREAEDVVRIMNQEGPQ